MEEKSIDSGNKFKLIVLTIIILVVAISGITYAFFSIQIIGNDEASSMRVSTTTLKLLYTDAPLIAGERIYPTWSQSKTITVENDGTETVSYNIIWKEILNELINGEMVISATCTASSGSCSDIPEAPIRPYPSTTNNVNISKNISIASGVTHTYVVTIEFKETGSNQNYNQNKQFYGIMNIEEYDPTVVALTTDQGTTGLSVGDTVTMSSRSLSGEEFYVVSTNSTETVLLAKYNLYVGDILDHNGSAYSLNKTLTSSDTGYGLQNSTAKGYISESIVQYIGVVPFSGTNYWDDSVCQHTGTSWSCTGTSGLKSEYANSGNPVGKTGTYASPYPYVYNSSMSNIAPSLNYGNGYGLAQNNGYTIAYYVEEYINRLGINGIGRLLTYEEEQSLESSNNGIVFNGTSYWLGSAPDSNGMWFVNSNGSVYHHRNFNHGGDNGVRPVIVISTSDIQSS